MNAFDSFFRFFALTDDSAERPHNLNLPGSSYPALPAVPGDTLRFLVANSDCAGLPAEQLSIGIRKRDAAGAGVVCGTIRKQAGETYSEIRLRVGDAPTGNTYRQFALMIGERNVMGTFRGQQSNLNAYVDAIAQHYRDFPYALIEVDRTGQDIRLRAYPNDRFSLHGEPLRIGIGTVRERNLNRPSLLAQKLTGVALAAEDQYTLSVSADIQKGNVFILDSVSYTAAGTEKPSAILSALGVTSGSFVRAGGAAVVAYGQPGTQTLANTNRPALQLMYESSSGGNDLYTAIIGGDVQIGNVYQVSASNATTKTVTAVLGDTKATLEAQFNSVSGRFVLPSGSVPVISVLPGTQVVVNTNSPTLQLTQTASLPARIVDRYTVYVGTSVVAGNGYELTVGGASKQVTAIAGDTTLSVAASLGGSANPFTVDVAPGTAVRAIARKGPRYHEADNLASITLLSARTFHGLPYVAGVQIPVGLLPGEYQLVLRKGETVVGEGNYLRLRSDTRETALIRFGAKTPGSIFGLTYAEDGLLQQIRLPVFVDSARLQTTESLTQTLDRQSVRGRTSAEFVRPLTTTLQAEAFHQNLWMALKHPVLYVDGKPYRSEGEYGQSEPLGKRRLRQAQTQLTEVSGFDHQSTFDSITDSLSGTYSLINALTGLDGLWMAVKRLNFVATLSEGVTLPAADYDLLIRAGAEPLRLTISHEGSRVATFLLSPNRLNHLRQIRFGAGRIQLLGEAATAIVTTSGPDLYDPQKAETDAVTSEKTQRSGDFGPDFNIDFN